jgi:copper chaperone
MQNVTLKITGMSCGHCVKSVEGALKKVTGVTIQEVKIGAATIALSAPATVEAACQAIAAEGCAAVEAK